MIARQLTYFAGAARRIPDGPLAISRPAWRKLLAGPPSPGSKRRQCGANPRRQRFLRWKFPISRILCDARILLSDFSRGAAEIQAQVHRGRTAGSTAPNLAEPIRPCSQACAAIAAIRFLATAYCGNLAESRPFQLVRPGKPGCGTRPKIFQPRKSSRPRAPSMPYGLEETTSSSAAA